MRRAISWLAILALPAVVLMGSPANAQKKNKKGAIDKDLDSKNTEQTIKAGVLVGKVTNIYEGSRKIRLQVGVPVTTLNGGAISGMQQAQVQFAVARARGDALGMRQAQLQIALQQANMYQVEVKNVEVEVEARDDVIVRTARPRADFDDKGRPKRLTRAELKELRGDPKDPGYKYGYKAEFGDVATEQFIQVHLVRKKGAPTPKADLKAKLKELKTKSKSKSKAKSKDKEGGEIGAADVLGENGPQASVIVILGETGGR